MIRLVDHINIATQDLQATRDFFVDVLGFEDGPRPDFPGFPGHWLYADGKAIVHLQRARGPVAPTRDSALNHVAFRTDDFDGLIAKLEKLGIPFRTTQMDNSPVRQLVVEDPNGVMVEINAPRLAP